MGDTTQTNTAGAAATGDAAGAGAAGAANASATAGTAGDKGQAAGAAGQGTDSTLLGGDETGAGTGSGDGAAAGAADGAGEITVKLPEGVQVNEGLFSEFKGIAKELGLNSEKAQKLFDLQFKATQAFEQEADTAWKQTQTEWADSAKSDSEYGGAKFDASLAAAKQAINKFGTPGFKEFLRDFGVGNHPELIRFIVRVGRSLGEDKLSGTSAAGTGAPASPSRDDILKARYPSMYPPKQ